MLLGLVCGGLGALLFLALLEGCLCGCTEHLGGAPRASPHPPNPPKVAWVSALCCVSCGVLGSSWKGDWALQSLPREGSKEEVEREKI